MSLKLRTKLTDLLICRLIDWLIGLIDWFCWFIIWSIVSLIDGLIDWLPYCLTDWLIGVHLRWLVSSGLLVVMRIVRSSLPYWLPNINVICLYGDSVFYSRLFRLWRLPVPVWRLKWSRWECTTRRYWHTNRHSAFEKSFGSVLAIRCSIHELASFTIPDQFKANRPSKNTLARQLPTLQATYSGRDLHLNRNSNWRSIVKVWSPQLVFWALYAATRPALSIFLQYCHFWPVWVFGWSIAASRLTLTPSFSTFWSWSVFFKVFASLKLSEIFKLFQSFQNFQVFWIFSNLCDIFSQIFKEYPFFDGLTQNGRSWPQ